jgi:hypothetical protein
MRFRFLVIGFVAASLVAPSSPASSRERHRHRAIHSGEVHVQQEHGVIPDGTALVDKVAKGTPESGNQPAATPATGSPNIPATCSQQNASSPACYSATQQARPTR